MLHLSFTVLLAVIAANALVVFLAIVGAVNSRKHDHQVYETPPNRCVRRFGRAQEKRDQQMRMFVALAITVGAAIGLGGCFWHHQAAVVTQPLPPLKPLK
jgi:hypothetical protein